EWVTLGGSVPPATSENIYVAKYGNDISGDGSFANPYASLAKAIDVANTLASLANPITIIMNTGIYVEDNSAGPLTITAEGISIVGSSPTAVLIMPSTLSNDFLLVNTTVVIARVTIVAGGASSAIGLSLAQGSFSEFINMRVIGFQTGVMCTGGETSNYAFDSCFFIDNGTGIEVNGTVIEYYNSTVIGSSALVTPANIGINITGSSSIAILDSGVCGICDTAIAVSNGATLTANALNFEYNTNGVMQTTR